MFDYLFDTSGFPPRWQCGPAWAEEPWLGWVHVVSDLVTWAAYLAIPILMIIVLRRAQHVPAPRLTLLFAAFIVACGSVHLVDAIIFWEPVYRLSAVIKLITACVSSITVIALAFVMPQLLRYRSPEQLEVEVAARTSDLLRATEQLQAEATKRAQGDRQLRQQEDHFRLALTAGRMGTWDWNLDTNFVKFDSAEFELTGLPDEGGGVDANTFFAIVHPDDQQELQQQLRQVIDEGATYNHTFRIVTPQGKLRWIAGRGKLLDESAAMRRLVGVNYDVTEGKENELALAAARAEAESASDAKSRFLANTSHEIRTPLTAILGCADALVRDPQSPQALEIARTIKGEGEQLLRLLNDVLDLSKIEAGKLEIRAEACSPAAVLTSVASLMRPPAVEKGLELQLKLATPIPRTLQTDPTRMRQVLLNLVSNAIKFTDQGKVEIVASTQEQPDGLALVVDVRDTGPGIDPQHLESIFAPFCQLQTAQQTRTGTGLGLTISQRIAEMLGGKLKAQSQPGKGSVFRLVLPVDSSYSGSQTDSVRPEELFVTRLPDASHGFPLDLQGTILVAEDTASVRFFLQRVLADFAGDVDYVANGQAALDTVLDAHKKGKAYDLVLMDMQMPIKTGYEAVEEIRKAGITVPIIALTASAMAGDRQRCFASGCDSYLAKPLDWDALVAEVVRLLRLSRQPLTR